MSLSCESCMALVDEESKFRQFDLELDKIFYLSCRCKGYYYPFSFYE